jgi:hypothetical protein
MRTKFIFTFLMLLFSISVVSAAPKFEMGWQLKGAEGFSGPNAILDRTGKTLGIVVCEVGVGIVFFTAGGERVWEFLLTPPVTAYPAVADVNGDGAEDIVAGDAVGRVVALDQSGNLIWSANTPGSIRAKCSPVIADLDGDDQSEILVGDNSGYLSCFDARGKLRWHFSGDGTQTGPPLVADIYDSPGKEIIVPSHDQHIYALKATGEWLWDLYFPDDLFPNSPPLLADLNQDHVPELYVGGGLNHFYQINLQTGKVDLAENVLLHINDAIVATDFDGDGAEEIIFGNKGAEARCFNQNGWQWKLQIEHDTFSSTLIVNNFDADPDLEILCTNDAVQLLEIDGTRRLEAKLPSAVNSAPLAGDFDNDGKLDVLVAGHGMFGSNLLACLKWDVPFVANPNAWLTFAGDRAHARYLKTNFTPLPTIQFTEQNSQAEFESPEKLQLLGGQNAWRFDVTNPAQQRLVLLTEIRFPDGSLRHFARHIQSAAERINLPFDVALAGNYQIQQQLLDAEQQQQLATRGQEMNYAGFAGDRRFLESIFTEARQTLEKWQTTNPQITRGLDNELAGLKGRLLAFEPGQTSEIGSLMTDAGRFLQIIRTGCELAPDKSFFAWEFCPWAYFHPQETLPTPASRTEVIVRELCRDEWESIAINLTNVAVDPIEIKIMASDLGEFPVANHLEFRRAVLLHAFHREPIADALPRLDQAQLISVPGLQTAQLWLTLNTRGLPAGDYSIELKMKTLDAEASEVILPLKIKVLDLALPPQQKLNFCVWSRAGRAPEYELQDQIEHGVNIHFGVAPQATCDASGKLSGKLDFAEHDAIVRRLTPHGRIMFVGPQGALQGQEFLSPAWRKAFITYLRIWVNQLKELGLDYNDWLLYPYDEPSTPFSKTTLNLVEVAKLIRQADPKILIYTDPTSGTNLESLDLLNGLIDVWCPSAELLERFADEMLPVIRPTAREIWFYDASGTSRTLSCLGLYRWRFWYAWNMNFTGAGWWTYYYDEPVLWDGPNPSGDYFSTVYTAPGAIVTSKRWEVAREGIEDFELLNLFKETIARAKTKGVAAELIQSAETVLENLPREIQNILKLTGRRTPISIDSVPQYTQATQAVREARLRICEECLKLKSND